MKKIFILTLLALTLFSCEDNRDLSICKGGIVVQKQTGYSNESCITVRLKGKLIECAITRYEASKINLGDTIK